MKKKVILFILAVVLAIICYKFVAGNHIKDKTYLHLETIGYTQSDIANIEIKHSFINKILSYNEWRIFVEFKKEPNIIFAFTYREKQMIRQGITSKSEQLDKDEISFYDNMFDNGELKSN